MMTVLIIKNVVAEGPGTIEDFLKEQGIPYTILEFYDCRAEIPDLRAFTHLVIMGGPMAVYEVDEHAFLSMELAMIRSFILNRKPVLGICLGAQMIASALGADVYAGPEKEIGWGRIDITPEGMSDPVFSKISVNPDAYGEVFQWHGDTFDLPKKSLRLASSVLYENQAFRYKENVYGLQFHIEVTPGMIEEWFSEEKGCAGDDMLRQSERIYPGYHSRARGFYEAFFKETLKQDFGTD